MSKEDEPKRPSFIAYQVREGEDNKAYFNRVGAAFPHKDGEGHDVLLDALPVGGRVTLRTPQERLQEAKESKGDDRREQKREGRRERDTGPRYER